MNQSAHNARATRTERDQMRDELYSAWADVHVWPVDEETWGCEVEGVITEHFTLGELFRYLADLVEEI